MVPPTIDTIPGADAAGYRITRLRSAQIDDVARLHVRGDTSFLATLGASALAHYYRTFLDYPQAVGMVARPAAGGPLAGFVVGTEDLRRHYRTFLLRRLAPMLPVLVARALTDRGVALGVLRRLRQVTRIVGDRADAHELPSTSMPPAHLMMVVVHPNHRGRGVGESLVQRFTAEMAARGVPRLVLGVRDDNHTARRLYERLGWQAAVLSRARDGTGSWLYIRDLSRTSSM